MRKNSVIRHMDKIEVTVKDSDTASDLLFNNKHQHWDESGLY